jgi:hypothetical protein
MDPFGTAALRQASWCSLKMISTPDLYNFHVRCSSAWEMERTKGGDGAQGRLSI